MEEWLSWAVLGRVADVASLVAFPLSAYAAWKVRLIARKVVFRARAAEMVTKIADEVEALRTAALGLPESYRDAQRSIRRCLERAQLIAEQSGQPEKRAVMNMKRMKGELDQLDTSTDHALLSDLVWRFVEELEGFLVHAEEAEENRRVGGADVG